MACFHPLTAFQTESGEILFSERGKIRRQLTLPCGQCIGCRLERSRQWAVRCMHEAQMHRSNCFVTLTYDDNNLQARSLDYSHFQKFMKRLRKHFGAVRFYMCGEYGEQFGRPHFHACLFGIDFPDKQLFKALPSGSYLYTSELLSKIWPFGYSTIGDVTFESAAYVARYVMKKVTGPNAHHHYWGACEITGEAVPLTPEFNRMSLKPGIGSTWLKKYLPDVYPEGNVLVNGNYAKAPRYYDKLFSSIEPLALEGLQFMRAEAINRADQTEARLAVKETVTKARLNFKKRGFS